MRAKAFLVVLGLALAPAIAHADPSAPSSSSAPSAAVNDAARARLTEGLRLYKQKRYDKAQAAFLQAYALTKSPPVLLVLGLTTAKLGRPLDALHQLEQFQREAIDPTPEQKSRATKAIAEAKTQLGAFEIAAPDGADVAIDGEKIGRAPLTAPVFVLPGKHTVAAGAESKAALATAQGTTKVTFGASRAAAPPSVVLEPEFGTGGGTAESATPNHARTEAPGLFSPPATMAPVYVAGAVGVVSLTAAIVLGGIGANADRNVTNSSDALSRNGKSAGSCPGNTDPTIAQTCVALASAQKTSGDVHTPFIATLAVGAGSAAFALGWYLLAPKAGTNTTESHTTEVLPEVSTNGAGIRVRVAF